MRKLLLVLGLIVLVLILTIWFFSNIFFYLILSLVLATILRPFTRYLSSFEIFGGRIPRSLSIFLAFAAVVFFFGSFVVLFIPLFSHQIDVLMQVDFDQVFGQVIAPIYRLEDYLIKNELTTKPTGFLVENLRSSFIGFIQRLDFSELINGFISITGGLLVGLLAIAFITFFFLHEDGILKRLMVRLIPNQYFEVYISALYKIEKLLSNYLIGLLFQMIAIFSLASVGLSIVGVEYAITIAIFAAVANLVPYLGPMLGGIFGMIVALSTSASPMFSNETALLLVKVFGVFSVVQMTDNVLLQPLIFSKSVKAHPLEIFVVIFVGATIAGIVGMIAAIPTYTIVRVSFTEIYSGFGSYKVFKN